MSSVPRPYPWISTTIDSEETEDAIAPFDDCPDEWDADEDQRVRDQDRWLQ